MIRWNCYILDDHQNPIFYQSSFLLFFFLLSFRVYYNSHINEILCLLWLTTNWIKLPILKVPLSVLFSFELCVLRFFSLNFYSVGCVTTNEFNWAISLAINSMIKERTNRSTVDFFLWIFRVFFLCECVCFSSQSYKSAQNIHAGCTIVWSVCTILKCWLIDLCVCDNYLAQRQKNSLCCLVSSAILFSLVSCFVCTWNCSLLTPLIPLLFHSNWCYTNRLMLGANP